MEGWTEVKSSRPAPAQPAHLPSQSCEGATPIDHSPTQQSSVTPVALG